MELTYNNFSVWRLLKIKGTFYENFIMFFVLLFNFNINN